MKKDQADEFERELMQPLAQALRTRLADAGEVHVNNEPRLMTGERVEYATGSKSCSTMHEPKSSFGPSAAKTSLPSGNGERAADSSSRFHKAAPMPATAPERPLTLSPNASAKPRICGMRNRPSRLAGPRASRERSEPPYAAWESSPQRGSGASCQRAKQPPNRCGGLPRGELERDRVAPRPYAADQMQACHLPRHRRVPPVQPPAYEHPHVNGSQSFAKQHPIV